MEIEDKGDGLLMTSIPASLSPLLERPAYCLQYSWDPSAPAAILCPLHHLASLSQMTQE